MFAQSVLLADIVVLVASFFVAYLMRTQLWYGGMLPLREFVWVLGLIVVLWPTLARSVGLTDSQTYLWPRRMFLLTARVHVIGGLALLSTLYMMRAVEVSRLFIQTFLVVSGFAAGVVASAPSSGASSSGAPPNRALQAGVRSSSARPRSRPSSSAC